RHVGERAADIDAKPDCGRECHGRTAEKDQITKAALYAGSLPDLSITPQRPALRITALRTYRARCIMHVETV
ncbi:MAG: hypothetical protein J2P55_01940, partial [Rhizobiales bacterium]|nr:hypothetical protein [Hyphomicrobiales bacterium]